MYAGFTVKQVTLHEVVKLHSCVFFFSGRTGHADFCGLKNPVFRNISAFPEEEKRIAEHAARKKSVKTTP